MRNKPPPLSSISFERKPEKNRKIERETIRKNDEHDWEVRKSTKGVEVEALEYKVRESY